MIEVRRGADRYRTDRPGIVTWHSFSSGAHYDADNLSFGPVIACDEHVVAPGAGFAEHAHARVELLSWVVEGTLGHADAVGRNRAISPGRFQYQRAGTGIRHSERNASETAPLRFVQIWLADEADEPAYAVGPPPLGVAGGSADVLRQCAGRELHAPLLYLFVAAGAFAAADTELRAGDSVRAREQTLRVSGRGELLVLKLHP